MTKFCSRDEHEYIRNQWLELEKRDHYLGLWEHDLRCREDALKNKQNKFVHKKKKPRKDKDYAAMAVKPSENNTK